MEASNPIDQTRLALAALTACLVKTISEQDESFLEKFKHDLHNTYRDIKDMELSHIGTMEILTWTDEFLKR